MRLCEAINTESIRVSQFQTTRCDIDQCEGSELYGVVTHTAMQSDHLKSSCDLPALYTSRAEDTGYKGEKHQVCFLLLCIDTICNLDKHSCVRGRVANISSRGVILISQHLCSFICHYLANYSLIRTLAEKKKSFLIAFKSSFSSALFAAMCYSFMFVLHFLIILCF